jgi:hypothetical protein
MTIWLMYIAFWIIEVKNAHSYYVILIPFYCKNGCTNAPQYYVVRIWPVLCAITDVRIFYRLYHFMNTKFSFLSCVKRLACTRPQKELCCDKGLIATDSQRGVFGGSPHNATSSNPFTYVSSRRKHCVRLARVFILFTLPVLSDM